jgi:hypothetical protein
LHPHLDNVALERVHKKSMQGRIVRTIMLVTILTCVTYRLIGNPRRLGPNVGRYNRRLLWGSGINSRKQWRTGVTEHGRRDSQSRWRAFAPRALIRVSAAIFGTLGSHGLLHCGNPVGALPLSVAKSGIQHGA